MLSLNDLVGKMIVMCPKKPFRDANTILYAVKLHAVESGGIWVEHPVLSEIVAQAVHKTVKELPNDPVFFFPYSEIEHLVAYSTRLDPEAFGL